MYPTVSLGPLDVSTYSLMQVAAVVVLVIGLRYRLRRRKRPYAFYNLLEAILYVLLGVWAGAWLASFLPHVAAHLRGVPLPPMWWQGRQWLGALGGGSLAGYVYCRCRGLAPGRSFDLFAPLVPLAQAVGRVGCLLAGCCYGRETLAWPSLVLPDVHGVWARRYPTRIASISANLLIFVLLVAFERYATTKRNGPGIWPFDGFLFLSYVELYCVQRFFCEFWRTDTDQLIGPLTWAHLYCVIGIGLATWGIAHGLRRSRGPLADSGSSPA